MLQGTAAATSSQYKASIKPSGAARPLWVRADMKPGPFFTALNPRVGAHSRSNSIRVCVRVRLFERYGFSQRDRDVRRPVRSRPWRTKFATIPNKTANPMIARHDGRHVDFNFEDCHSQRRNYGGKSPIALFVDELATALKGGGLCATGVQPTSNSPPARRSASVQIRSTLSQA
jgi:hypothetical protein